MYLQQSRQCVFGSGGTEKERPKAFPHAVGVQNAAGDLGAGAAGNRPAGPGQSPGRCTGGEVPRSSTVLELNFDLKSNFARCCKVTYKGASRQKT